MPEPLLQSLEPPNGDFVKYVESLVGPSLAQDPEIIARVVSARLREQSERNHAIMNAIDTLPSRASASEVRAATDAARRAASSAGPTNTADLSAAHTWGMNQGTDRSAPQPAATAPVTAASRPRLPADAARQALRGVVATAATGMLMLGVVLVGTAIFVPGPWSEVLMVPGLLLSFFGFIIRRSSSK